ncbi:LysR family transcriptional regulator [Pseudoroseicyclus aestuarii]|uniref:LysR family transcriptional regulator n=1 Tax=Pseudoroseicyclus aestuarii TaxID=1795041 RepID=A0A318SWQ0_9RHOB|nr:LysR family transcriptional regulator [Pseudoroseicyclus aestuarii]PYE84829.1 LysR family transcriptional regulator [Pseudoroseicyclus aestuarii]
MTLDQLRIFVAVAERQHLTRAAQVLNMTPSAASAAIRAFEDRSNARLFDRVGRGIELTRAGRAFLPEARAVLAAAHHAEAALAEHGAGGALRGTVEIHASQTIANHWLPPRLMRLHAAQPGLDLRLTLGNTAQVTQAVREGRAELGFIEGLVAAPALLAEVIATDELVVLVAPDHPWAGTPPKLADLAQGAAWIMREEGSGTRSEFEAALAALGVAPRDLRIGLVLPSNEAVLNAVQGPAAAALSSSVAGPLIATGALRRVDLPLPPRAFTMLRHGQRQPGRALSAVIEAMRPAAPG